MADVATSSQVVKRDGGSGIRVRRARVTFSYEPQHEDELALKVGDELIIEREDEEGWYEATLNGKSGVCPSNFVEMLADESETMTSKPDVKDHKDKLSNGSTLPRENAKDGDKKPPAESTPTKDTPTDSQPVEEGKREGPKKIVGVGFGDIFKNGGVTLKKTGTSNGSEKVIGSAAKENPSGIETERKSTPERQLDKTDKDKDRTTTPTPNKENSGTVEYCKAEYDYKAANGDELSFQVGDVIRVISRNCEDEGWWMGEFNGHSGVFPDNFVVLIQSSEAPPKRPARPLATEKNAAAASGKKEEPKSIRKDSKEEPKVKEEPKSSTATKTPIPADKTPKPEPARPEKPSKPVISTKPKVTNTGSLSKSREESPLNDAEKPTSAAGHSRTASVGSDAGVKTEADAPGRIRSTSGLGEVVMRHHQAHTNGHAERASSTILDSVPKRNQDGTFDDVQTGVKLSHMTATRPRGPHRRPPSMIRPNSEEEEKVTPNGLDAVDEAPSVEPKSDDSHKALTETQSEKDKDKGPSLAKKNSFLKELDAAAAAIGIRPRSPSTKPTPIVPSTSMSLDEEVRHLREEIKSLKEMFAGQMTDLQELVKTQATKIGTLEKELAEVRKTHAK